MALTVATIAGMAMPAGANTAAPGCDSMSSPLSRADIRSAIGLDGVTATGAGVDVAVVDTGVSNVAGLDGGRVVDAVDLSLEAGHTALRHGDLNGHGTNMASIIADSRDGVAPGARIIDVKVGAGNGAVDVSQLVAAVDWVADHRRANGMNIRVLYLAVNSDTLTKDQIDAGAVPPSYLTDPLAHAVEQAWRKGIVVVVAGGNDGRGQKRLGNPAIDPYVISVGAAEQTFEKKVGKWWKVASLSSTGDGVRNPDVVAPGVAILGSAVPGSYLATTFPAALCSEGGWLRLRGSGTSQAGAMVAGTAAVLLQQRPSLSPDQVKALIRSTATSVLAYDGRQTVPYDERVQGKGMVNVSAALAAPVPGVLASAQTFPAATGTGSLEAARTLSYLQTTTGPLTGEVTAYGAAYSAAAMALARTTGATWTGATWTGATWTGGTWSGATWTGATWTGATWTGATWTGATWTGATWSGATWSGAVWS